MSDHGRSPDHIRNLFKRGELLSLSKDALQDAKDFMQDFDAADPGLHRAMVGLFSNTLKRACRRGTLPQITLSGRKVAWRYSSQTEGN